MKVIFEIMLGSWAINSFIGAFIYTFIHPSDEWFSRFALGCGLLGILILCDYARNILNTLNEVNND